jgi:DNA polymerase-1
MAIAGPGRRPVGQDRQARLLKGTVALQGVVRDFLAHPDLPVAFDTETTGLDSREDKLVMLQFGQGGKSYIFDMRHATNLLEYGHILRPLFSGDVLILGMNLKFDYGMVLEHLNVRIRRVFDIMLADQVIEGLGKSDGRKKGKGFNLKDIAHRYGYEIEKEDRNWFVGLDKRPEEWNAPFPPEILEYAALDVDILEPIMKRQMEKLKERRTWNTAVLEMQALPCLAEMEAAGININVDGWREIISEKKVEADALEVEVMEVFGDAIMQDRAMKADAARKLHETYKAARGAQESLIRKRWEDMGAITPIGAPKWGEYRVEQMRMWRSSHKNPGPPKAITEPPNIDSPQQLMAAFRVLGIDADATDSDTLEELSDTHPFLMKLVEYRKASKFVTSFGEKLLAFRSQKTGRIHPSYEQIGASTGRMSCKRPNWQQIPRRGNTGKRLRGMVQAEIGNRLIVADFSNIELRIIAELSRDETMLRFFSEGKDLHAETAYLVFRLDRSVDVKEYEVFPGWTARDTAKTVNFGLIYGQTPMGLALTLGISTKEAEKIMDEYFRVYSGVAAYLAKAAEEGVKNLCSKTIGGRKRYYSLPANRDKMYRSIRGLVERQAKNTPVQGTSADITKLALALLYREIDHVNVRVVAVVHDEIVMEASEGLAELAAQILGRVMEKAARAYLKLVHVPETEVVISDHWVKG